MNRFKYFFLFAFFPLIFVSSCSVTHLSDSGSGTKAQTGSTMVSYSKEELQQQKLSQFRQRIKFKSIIRKGDYFSVKNMKEAALKYYLNAYAKLKNDYTLELKIGDILFELKRFNEAYNFYRKVPFETLSASESDRIAKTMYYASSPTRDVDVEHLSFDAGKKDYYTKIISPCQTNIHNCILSIEAYSGSYEPGKKLVDAVKNYEKVSADFFYRNALVAGLLLASKDHKAAAVISDEILTKRPGYKPVLKLAGFAHYELGEYNKANESLQKYYEIDPKDIQASYALGIINYELGDYTTSNLYFNTAVINGYEPKTELERRMVYNYFVLDDHRGMFKVFRYLLDEKNVTVDDYIIAIYTSLEKHELSKASLWSEKGVARFPDSDNIYALQGWTYQLKGDELESLASLGKSLSLNPRNVIALLRTGVWHYTKKEYTEAKVVLTDVANLDKGGQFGTEALEYLDKTKREEMIYGTGETLSGTTIQ